MRLPTSSAWPTRRRTARPCTMRSSTWRSTRRVSGSDLAGRPRLDDDYVVISTVHSAKGLEWPVVHLPQLVDGAVPSDMALTSPGLEEEQRLFYVAVTRARDRLYLYAPLRMHHHRMAATTGTATVSSPFPGRRRAGALRAAAGGAAAPALRPSAPLALSVDRDWPSCGPGLAEVPVSSVLTPPNSRRITVGHPADHHRQYPAGRVGPWWRRGSTTVPSRPVPSTSS